MISKQVETVEHMTCECGRHPRLMQHSDSGVTRYTVEAHCCKTITIPLKTARAATNEFQRLRAVQHTDRDSWPEEFGQHIGRVLRDKQDVSVVQLYPKGQQA